MFTFDNVLYYDNDLPLELEKMCINALLKTLKRINFFVPQAQLSFNKVLHKFRIESLFLSTLNL